jgi:ribosomal protein L11 methyltransferase
MTGGDVVVEVTAPRQQVELIADQLWVAGATAVEERSVPDRDDALILVAGFPTPQAAAAVADRMRAEAVEITDGSWRDAWKRYASPVNIGSIVVTPGWKPLPVGPLVIEIDPGPCFGSGSHPTTRLLLAELERRVRPGDVVLDVGTGSGVLAVAAARLGAARVTAVDIDPEALAVTGSNAARNGVAERIDVSLGRWEDVAFDIVVANLTAGVLASLAGPLVSSVSPGGTLLLSGLLPGQWPHIATDFAELPMIDVPTLEGWVGVVLGGP